jgi:hypothetical protein
MKLRRTRHAFLITVLALLVGFPVAFWPFLASPDTLGFFGYGDAWMYNGPVLTLVDYAYSRGELPLWNPLMLCGHPAAANPSYLAFYPPNVLRSLLTPGPTPWNMHVGVDLMLYAQLVFAGLGAYWLARRHQFCGVGAFTAAIAFAFSCALTNRVLGHLNITLVVTWLPWTLLALRAAMEADSIRTAFGYYALLGVAFSGAILAGSPQITAFVAFALVIYWVAYRLLQLYGVTDAPNSTSLDDDAASQAVADGPQAPSGPIRASSRIRRDIPLGVFAVLVAVLLSAPHLFPALEFVRLTNRTTQGGSSVEYEWYGSEAGWSLPETLIVYGGNPNYEGMKGVGALALFLAVPACFSRRRRTLGIMLVMAAFFIDAGRHNSLFALDAIAFLTPFAFSSPERTSLIASLPLAMLAGLGVDTLVHGIPTPRRRALATFIFAVAGGYIAVVVASRYDAENFLGLVGPFAVAAPALGMLAYFGGLWSSRRIAAAWVIAALTLAEPVYWRYQIARGFVSANPFFNGPKEAVSQTPAMWDGNSRMVDPFPNLWLYELKPNIGGADPLQLVGARDVMSHSQASTQFWRGASQLHLALSTNRHYLMLKRAFWLQSQYVSAALPPVDRLFPPTTTAFLSNPGHLHVPEVSIDTVPTRPYSRDAARVPVSVQPKTFVPGNAPTAEQPLVWASKRTFQPDHKSLSLHIRSDCAAKFVILAKQEPQDDAQIVGLLHTEARLDTTLQYDLPMPDMTEMYIGLFVDFGGETGQVVLERVEVVLDEADESEKIELHSRTANTVDLTVHDLPGYRVLSFIDFAYPGWRAYVDGKRVPILRAFSHFKAVELPPGTHTVRFEYHSRTLYLGFAACLLALAVVGFAIVWSRIGRTRGNPVQPTGAPDPH